MYTIKQLAALSPATIMALSDVLLDCVDGNASVSFMYPLSRDKADAFWHSVAADVALGKRILLVAENDGGDIVGTVQAILSQPDNQPHRADIAKMLVHRNARRQGLAAALMLAVEKAAAHADKTMLVLDTVTGSDAERLYAKLGWHECGKIPDYALFPRRGLCSTTVFYKAITV